MLLHGWFAKQLMNWMQFVKQGNKIPISLFSGRAKYSLLLVCWLLFDLRSSHDKVKVAAAAPAAAEHRGYSCRTSDCQKHKCEMMY